MIAYTGDILEEQNRIDGIWLWADMAGNQGTFFSEEFYKAHIFPLHKNICAHFSKYRLPVVIHSDGNLNRVMPYLVEAGFKGLHPVEAAAGMDLGGLETKYGDKMVFLWDLDLDRIMYKERI
jgi:uroporphyrinogen decarboxylase